jgi:hypothetical protein
VRIVTVALTAKDIKAIKEALSFTLEFATAATCTNMQPLLQRFNNLVVPTKGKG